MPQNGEKKRILIIDDEEGLRVFLKSHLENYGFEVIEGANGLETMKLVKQSRADLIIMDCMMPKMDGIKASALLKSDSRYDNIPIIMLTASAEKSDRNLSEQVGVEAFMNKPVNVALLIDKIRELLAHA